MKIKSFLYLIIVVLLQSGSALAMPVVNLYQASVLAPAGTSGDNKEALRQAYQNVLIKVSGAPDMSENPEIKTALQNPGASLQQYSFSNHDGQAYLVASFYPQAINGLLKANHYPIWGSHRPEVLIWLVVNQTKIENATDNDDVKNNLYKFSLIRGLPLIFPLGDLNDLQSVTTLQLCQPDLNAVLAASKRYHPDIILLACLNKNAENSWQGQFTLMTPNQNVSWNTQGDDLQNIARQGLDETIKKITANTAATINSNEIAAIKITVSNVKNNETLNKLRKYLSQLTQVKQMAIDSVTPDSVSFDVQALGGTTAIQQSLSLNHSLAAVNNENNNDGLYYQWIS